MRQLILVLAIALLAAVFCFDKLEAGAPFNNLEGVGGVAFNPLAYLAEGDVDYKLGNIDFLGKPRFGAWYINLPNYGSGIDWTAFGVADTFFKRLEVSYGYEVVAINNSNTYHKNNIGAKFLLLKENTFDLKFAPAVSIGTIFKSTNKYVTALRKNGFDWYAVATKTIKAPFAPVIVSAGLLSSSEYVTGVLGFNNKRQLTGFANIDIVLPYNLLVGYEFKQGEQFNTGYKNNNYWNAHLAWLANKNLSFIAAYVDTGSTKTTRTGLGTGVVLSAQYSF